jgi:hypothetical protein
MPKTLFQWYSTIHYSSCEACLRRHGDIFQSDRDVPALHPGCRCHILEIPSSELEYYREKSDRMKEKALAELARRASWSAAVTLLPQDFAQTEALFRQAIQTDLYLEEIEALVQKHKEWFSAHSEERATLGKLFVRGYRIKFNQDKYQSLAAGMRVAQEQHGIERIRELFV